MSYRSCRRRYLDESLANLTKQWSGNVIDIGGERINQRGRFQLSPSLQRVIVNLDSSSQPDLIASAESLPFTDGSFDHFLITEVLEHVPGPGKALSEASRVLKPGGDGVISMPFLVGVHGDPGDFQRWTQSGLQVALEGVGLDLREFTWNGGLLSVIADMAVSRLTSLKRRKRLGYLFAQIIMPLTKLVMLWERRNMSHKANPKFSTGWTARVTKAGGFF